LFLAIEGYFQVVLPLRDELGVDGWVLELVEDHGGLRTRFRLRLWFLELLLFVFVELGGARDAAEKTRH
jgi:hypothetical protein